MPGEGIYIILRVEIIHNFIRIKPDTRHPHPALCIGFAHTAYNNFVICVGHQSLYNSCPPLVRCGVWRLHIPLSEYGKLTINSYPLQPLPAPL